DLNPTGRSPNPNKPADRRGQVLFINADAEFHAGRAQNYLRPEHVEKIVSTFDKFENVDSYARVVPLSEIASEANDFNLNIRRYVDNSPPPEPHDVRAPFAIGAGSGRRPARGHHLAHARVGQEPQHGLPRPQDADDAAPEPLQDRRRDRPHGFAGATWRDGAVERQSGASDGREFEIARVADGLDPAALEPAHAGHH